MSRFKLQSVRDAGPAGQGERAQGAGAGIVVSELWELLRRRWLVHTMGATIGVAGALGWFASREPVYRAEATLRLEQQGSNGSLLSDLAALTQAPVAVSEMEILRSRTIAEAVVASPPGGAAEVANSTEAALRLGLTTLVEDEALRPSARLARLVGLGTQLPVEDAPRLFADVRPPDDAREVPELVVEVLAADRASVRAIGALGAGDAVEVPLTAAEFVPVHGVMVRLVATGDLTGRTFRLHRDTTLDAIERVMKATRVSETDRNSGVIRVVVQDSDPARAADTVNALCGNYLQRNQSSSERRASQTVAFIEAQLEEQLARLAEAEDQVVSQKKASPEFVDMGEAARALIQKLSELEVRRIEGRIQHAGLEEAIALVDAGDLAALSRLGPESADPVTASLVESIARLSAEAEVLERTDTGTYKAMLQEQLVALRAERDARQLKLETLRDVHTRLGEGDATVLGSLIGASDAGVADPMLTAYVERWTELDARSRTLEGEFTDALPELRTVRSERDAIQGRIRDLIAGRMSGLEAQLVEYDALAEARRDRLSALPGEERGHITAAIENLRTRALTQLRGRLAGIGATLASIEREVAQLEDQLGALPESERTLATPMRAVVTHGEIVKLLLLRKQEAEITKAATIATAEFIDVAHPPRKPIGPSLPVHLVMGLAVGLAAAAAFALVREGRGREVQTAAELELATGLTVVGSIPDFRRGRTKVKDAPQHFVALRDDPEGPIAEAYRALRSNLKFLIGHTSDRKTLAITSCVPGEGKSVTNVDVALSFAMSGKRVLLVDADMRKPSVSKYLRLGPQVGLSDVLRETVDWRSCLVHGCHENLDVLPSGGVPEAPGDLLAGATTRALIAEVRASYDLVVFDVPPVLAVADIECLAPHVDAVLLLCRSSKLTDSAVRHAVNRLRQVGANLVGAVLNAVVARGITSGDYGYGYGYGYGTDGQRKDKRAA